MTVTHKPPACADRSGNQRQEPPPAPQSARAEASTGEPFAAVRVALKSSDSSPEDDECYVGEDGVVVTAPADDKSRNRRLKQLLAEREHELQQAAEYGIGLLDRNEELQLQLASLQIQAEAEAEALAVERDTFKRRHDHALLEVESWKRRFTRVEEEKYELAGDFERFAAQCTCRSAGDSNSGRIAELTHKVAELELALATAQAAEQASAATIAQLRAWKREVEHQQKESQELELLEAQRDQTQLENLATENAKVRKTAEQLAAENEQLKAHTDACAQELRAKKREAQALLDELAELRLECSAKAELLLTAEARSSRLQRELALLEDVSYLSFAVIDNDTEEDDDSDEDAVDHSKRNAERRNTVKLESVAEDGAGRESLAAASDRRESIEGLMPSPFAAFPAAVRAANGKPVAVSSTDLEGHKKLHHYFHLTAQSIIHENKLHDRCFRSSSRFTIDSWYREIIALDIPYLEWHAWLINRISEVAASVQSDEDRALLSPSTSSDSGRHPRGLSGFFLRKDTESSSPASATASTASSPSLSHRQRHVPFSVARAFFRLLRGRKEPELDSSSEE